MQRNMYARIEHITDVMGRIDYISSPDRQENLYAIYRTKEDFPWNQLAAECRSSFRKSGTEGRCIEAREMILALPEEFQQFNPQELLGEITEHFKAKYETECVSALHHNEEKTNYHIHLIFAEREFLDMPEIKLAQRNMFLDVDEKRSTKKAIHDENGKLKEGCSVIKKGELVSRKLFGKKNPYFKSREFVRDVKQEFKELINSKVQDEEKKLSIYDSSDIYLPTKKIGKNNPKELEIKDNNKAVAEWNMLAYKAAEHIPREMLKDIKRIEITDRIAEAKDSGTEAKGRFRKIVKDAAAILIRFVRKWDRTLDRDKPEPKSEGFFKMLDYARKLVRKDREWER